MSSTTHNASFRALLNVRHRFLSTAVASPAWYLTMAPPESSHPFHWHYGEMDDNNFQINGRSSILLLVVVFALIVLFTVMCLYAKWACRYRRLAAALGERAATAAQGDATVVVVTGLDQNAINSLPVRIMGSPAVEEPCSICLCNMAKGAKVKVLPVCSHGFHSKCIDQWLRGQASCPICRASLTTEPAQPAALV